MTVRDRRAVLVGGITVVGAVFALRLLPWGVRYAVAAERGLSERAGLLARARVDLARAALLRDSAAVLAHALVGLAPKLLSGSSIAEATADLSGRLNLAASRNAVRLERVDQHPDTGTAGRLHRVRLRATLESDVRGLAGVLRAVELGEAALAITDLRIVAMDPSSANHAPEVMRLELTVAGWFLTTPAVAGARRAS